MKNATVSARVEYSVKNEAEDILHGLGIPVSVVINALYRQIILRRGIPFPIVEPKTLKSLDSMTKAEFDTMLQHSYEQSLNGEGRPLDAVFDELEKDLP